MCLILTCMCNKAIKPTVFFSVFFLWDSLFLFVFILSLHLGFSVHVKIRADLFKTLLDVSLFSRAVVLPPVLVVSAGGRPEDEGRLPPL